MDYEKKYKEALEIARQFSEHPLQEDSSTIVEYIFPELQESKDERIRESLLEYLHTLPNHYSHDGVCAPEWIAWLEKQSEKDKIESLRTEYEKGRADVLRLIDPDEMVADFCSQPFSMTRSIASIYRQGIIDIVKRINRNEETDINSTRSIDDGGVR